MSFANKSESSTHQIQYLSEQMNLVLLIRVFSYLIWHFSQEVKHISIELRVDASFPSFWRIRLHSDSQMFFWSWKFDHNRLPFLWLPLRTRSSGGNHSSSPMAFARLQCLQVDSSVYRLRRGELLHDPIYSCCSWGRLWAYRVPLALPSAFAWTRGASYRPSAPVASSSRSITSPFASRWRSWLGSVTHPSAACRHRWRPPRRKRQLHSAYSLASSIVTPYLEIYVVGCNLLTLTTASISVACFISLSLILIWI